MESIFRELLVRNFAARTGSALAVAAIVMSVVSAVFVPYGYPWPSLAWAVMACAAADWVAQSAVGRTPRMIHLMGDIEAEAPGLEALLSRGNDATGAIS
jgi:hypothetical protein